MKLHAILMAAMLVPAMHFAPGPTVDPVVHTLSKTLWIL